jgi:hypothetical protein
MRVWLRILLICAVLPLALSCEEQGDVEVTLQEELRHANGLAVRRPDGFRAIEEAAGFAFEEEGMIRSPRFLRVLRLEQAPSQEPTGSRKLESGVSASYAVEKRSGGSAGDEYELTAWRAAGDSWIAVSETAQSELGEPDFAVAWVLVDQARIAAPTE